MEPLTIHLDLSDLMQQSFRWQSLQDTPTQSHGVLLGV